MTHGAGQAGSGVFGIEPAAVEQAAGELTGYGDQMEAAGRLLRFTGVAPPTALPGGLVAKALAVAATTVSRSVTGEGTAACATADSLLTFVDTVRTAEAEAATDLEGAGS